MHIPFLYSGNVTLQVVRTTSNEYPAEIKVAEIGEFAPMSVHTPEIQRWNPHRINAQPMKWLTT